MKLIKKIFLVFIAFILLLATAVTIKGYIMYRNALKENPLDKLVERIQSKANYTKFEELPKTYVDAVLAVEDHRFYKHHGMDIIAIGRAVVNDVKAGKLVQGGSTITQQLAKNMYFSLDKKFDRKIAEMFMAWNIERNYEKEEIFELYINTSYFGDGYYTVKEASQGYFNKDPKEMTDNEATMLAGIPNAPAIYAPTNNLELAKQRQKQVINAMVKHKYLSNEEAEKILEF